MRVSLAPLALLLLAGCSDIGSSVKGFGKDIISIIPGSDSSVTMSVSETGMSQEEEFWLGKAVAAQIFSIYKPSSNEGLNSYLSKVGQSLVRFSSRPDIYGGYSFQLLESDQVNAVSAPGGFIFITEGMLKLLKNEEDLAAVLAHEIAHIQQRHGIAAIQASHKSKGMDIGGKIVSAVDCTAAGQLIFAAFEGAVQDVVDTLLQKGFSRDQEFEADRIARDILERAGYNPYGLAEVLAMLQRQNVTGGGWFDTHPAPIDRLHELGFSFNQSSGGFSPIRDQRFLGSTHN